MQLLANLVTYPPNPTTTTAAAARILSVLAALRGWRAGGPRPPLVDDPVFAQQAQHGPYAAERNLLLSLHQIENSVYKISR